ncbi:Glutamate 5-kinase [Bartonella clarridgeiae 73]|uniref:Glutamate 5-kinase n=1 Tax=Bartonella clarridgeiae (strain CCUG 45776 / CIP 104772 / 73) TaxID=696125 RepID=E6YIV5_BARC7|nr:glutamate 5-kinase [Bartonella clarridgeiae]WCR54642.1 MAG: Glutamate 5-kinase [Bartonella clarridgeiae]CBI76793.1 Glutamate 5-kinase [Bartonella clarridgeiae 73]
MAFGMQKLAQYKRIVIKVGSALLVDPQTGLRVEWLKSLISDVVVLRQKGVEVLLVSSGAIALGRTSLNLSRGFLKLEESQACAALGQIELAKAYGDVLAQHGLKTGQILLTLSDTEERRRYLNARATIDTLLRLGVVPIINENDTVATSEIRYGDNDRLAARVATMIGSDLLILLSDVDGLYTCSPHLNPEAEFVAFVASITRDIEEMAGVAASEFSRGGMKTKLDAGKIATSAGTAMIITSGKRMNPLVAIDKGERSSFFAASEKPVNAWKTWISGHLDPSGVLTIDQGAVKALASGKSLLAAGVIAVEGMFDRGDTVAIVDKNGIEIARGLINYGTDEAKIIIGRKSEEIEYILGNGMCSAVVHRNDMVLRCLPD